MIVEINHRILLRVLSLSVALLVIFHLVTVTLGPYVDLPLLYLLGSKLERFFNLDGTANIPSWFGSVMLLLAAVLLGIFAAGSREERPHDLFYWRSLSGLFIVLSLDQAAGLHLRFGDPLSREWHLIGLSFSSWILLLLVLSTACVLVYSRFVARLPRKMRKILVASAVLYITGAIGMKMLQGIAIDHLLAMAILIVLEESLKLIGVVVFIHSLLLYLEQQHDSLRIVLRKPTR